MQRPAHSWSAREAEATMLRFLLLGAAVSLGQTEAAPPPFPGTPAQETLPAPPPPAPAPDRWLLMKSLQGSYPGWLLDGSRMQVYGWTDISFTASSASDSNLPLGFNHRANEFLLQQNWLRFERSVVSSGTTDPTFGFRTDTILPGADYRFTLARGIFDSQLTANNGQPNLY